MAETKRTLLERILSKLEILAVIKHRLDLLSIINEKLDRLLSRPVRFRLVFGTPEIRDNLPAGAPHNMATTLTDIEHVAVVLETDDAAGNPVAFDGTTPPAWVSSDEAIVTVSANADGSNADVATTGKLGNAQITVKGTNAAGQPITGIGDVTVVTSGPTTFKLNFGTPAAK